MEESLRDEFLSFFEKFSDLSDRAVANWPLPKLNKDVEEDTGIGYEFKEISTQEDLSSEENKNLTTSFFTNLYQLNRLFSGSQTIRDREQIEVKLADKNLFERTVGSNCGNFRENIFLLIGHIPGEKIARVACVGLYFYQSQTIFIESIWMADELQKHITLGSISNVELVLSVVKGLKSEHNKVEGKIRQLNKEQNQQTVLSWLLTYQNSKRDKQSALLELIKKYATGIKDPISSVFLEVQNPTALALNKNYDQIRLEQAAKRLAAFHKIKTRYIKFAYERPNPDKGLSKEIDDQEYLLLTLPQLHRKSGKLDIDMTVVMRFILDYGKHLLDDVYADTRYKEDFNNCNKYELNKSSPIKSVDDTSDVITRNHKSLFSHQLPKNKPALYLHSIPRLEQPRFAYHRSSICFEILVDEDYFEPEGLSRDHDLTPSEPERAPLAQWFFNSWKKWFPPKYGIPEALYCPVAHSVETDLFAYRYQADPPYFTHYYDMESTLVEVKFPSHFEFTSEGRIEDFYRLPRTKEQDEQVRMGDALPQSTHCVTMEACVSYTYFLKSAVRVWHLVLKPLPVLSDETSNDVSELDIIKLMQFFSGSQEYKNEKDRLNSVRRIEFEVIDEDRGAKEEQDGQDKPDNLIKLLHDLIGVSYKKNENSQSRRQMDEDDQVVSLRNVRSGVVEIDTGDVSPESERTDKDDADATSFLGFYETPTRPATVGERNEIRAKVKELYEKLYEDNIQMEGDPEPFTAEEYADYVFKSYCGICLGIFDYDRMSIQEIDDTLVPLTDSKTKDSFLVIHRGVLAMLGHDDNVMETFWDTLGTNPYLLIPSAVLAHNDMVARDADNRLDKLLKDLREGQSRLSVRRLNKERNVIDDLLNDDLLGNVFQYKTEQEIYEQGMKRRSIDDRITNAKSKLEQLEKLINEKQEAGSTRYQRRITFLATLVGIFSFYEYVRNYFQNELSIKILNSHLQCISPFPSFCIFCELA